MLPKRKRRSDKLIVYLDDGQRNQVEALRQRYRLRSWNETIRVVLNRLAKQKGEDDAATK